jgi:hypothetical protein
MIENLIVALIVGGAAWHTGRKYLWRAKKPASGCGSGCSSCGTCADAPAPAQADGRKVIRIHSA